jgi:hypothetical protein
MKETRLACLTALLLILAFAAAPLAAQTAPDNGPLTAAEASQYKSTSLYKDVMDFIHALQARSPFIRVETLGRTAEGRDIPLLVLADPPVFSPLDPKRDGRVVVYIQANIHPGEVEGKEASLMLARDILLKKKPDVLDKLVVLIAPDFNADGNEKINQNNRPQQNGPENGVGVRTDALNLDLNRDAIKLESPEMQGTVRNVLNRWDPALAMDLHTTDGFFHEEPVTFAWAPIPAGDPDIRAFMRDKLQVAVEDRMRTVHKIAAILYGEPRDYRDFSKGFESFGFQPYFFTNYVGLRNRLSILNENYNHADFKTRVQGCYDLLESVLFYVRANAGEVLRLVTEADRKAVARGLNPTAQDRFGLTFEPKPLERKLTINIYEMEIIPREGSYPEMRQTDRKKTLVLPFYGDFEVKTSVAFPAGYFIAVPDETLIGKLRQHGLVVQRLAQPVSAEVEAFRPKEIKTSARPFQGHWMDQVKGDYVPVKKDFPAGTYFVPTGQPLGSLAATLLEPGYEGGLLTWNYLDKYLVPEWSRSLAECPVYRLLRPVDFATDNVR